MSLEKHTTPASGAGFQYQFDRALLALVKGNNGDSVGIETLDDVSVKMSNGELLLEQNKISLQEDTEIFSNRSKNLWNSLSTWISAIRNQEIDVNRTTFLLVTNKKCNSSIVLEISKAKTDEEAEKCISILKSAAVAPTDLLKPLMDNVLSADIYDALRQLIIKIKLIELSDPTNILEEIKKNIQIPTSAMEHIERIVFNLSGWLQNAVMQAWFNNSSAWISHEALTNQIFALIESLKRNTSRERLKHLIALNPVDISSQSGATFVKQLYLISDENDLVEDAIENYLCCKSEKTRLSLEGEITNDDWIDFDAQLLTRWKNSKRRIIASEKNKSEQEQGMLIFTDISDFKADLAGVPTTQLYLSQGTLHRMADEMSVGWHPRYKELLK